MDIGSYFLQGQVVNLKRPFLVIEKTVDVNEQELQQVCEKNQSQGREVVSQRMNAIIRRKVVFKNRPKPRVSESLLS